jgi:hypothetical protein
MSITLEQMAQAYIASVQQEIEKAKDVIRQNTEYLAQIEAHLLECQENIALGQSLPSQPVEPQVTVEPQPDGTIKETISLPNPFEQLQGQ